MQGRNRDADVVPGLVCTVGGESGADGGSSLRMYTLSGRMASWGEVAVEPREPRLVLWDGLQGWGEGEEGGKGGRGMCV